MSLARSLIALSLLLTACPSDDTDTSDTETDTDDTDTSTEDPAIVGSWVSTGDDVSPLFQTETFDYTTITADFASDGTYEVAATNGGGTTTTFTGTYTVGTGDPATITLEQSAPSTATAVGIWSVADDAGTTTLTYEVVQTVPDFGFTPPTPETGFGSTSGPGLEADVNIQIFRAAE
jgi:hypothetical protein